jgi:hypothetical protein
VYPIALCEQLGASTLITAVPYLRSSDSTVTVCPVGSWAWCPRLKLLEDPHMVLMRLAQGCKGLRGEVCSDRLT